MEIFIFIGRGSIAFLVIIIAVLFYKTYEAPRVRAGKQGEKAATEIIKQVLKEDDYEWTKYKVSRGGNIYEKQVRNPIKQVRRQVFILARFLKYYGFHVWVDGYVLLLNNNSPVHSDMILESFEEIDWVLHGQSRNSLNGDTVTAIKELLV